MKHGDVQGRLGPYLEGDLPLQQRALVDAHLDVCSNCAEELKELRATIGLLHSMPEVEAPPGLAGRVLARVRAGEAEATFGVRVLDGLDLLLRSRPLVLAAASLGALALVVLAPAWWAEQTKPSATALTPSPSDASQAALARRLAPLNVWIAQAPFVRRPLGASAPDEEPATPVAPGAEPLAVGPELASGETQIEQILRDPRGFLEELSLLPQAERDEQLSALLEEAIRAGRTAELVQSLRTTGDRRADVILDRLELTSSSVSAP